jgi:tetratricopeptide (TPR) repeat protein
MIRRVKVPPARILEPRPRGTPELPEVSFLPKRLLSPPLVAVAVFSVALSLRALHLHDFRSTIFFRQPVFDEAFYDQTARSIAAGNRLGNTPFFMGPLYSYFLGFLYALSGGSRYFALMVQAAVGSATCALTYLIARRVVSELAAVLGALFLAFYGIVVYYDGLLLMETLVLFLNMLSILMILSGIASKRWYFFLIAGCCLGLSALGRATVLLVALGAAIWLLLAKYSQPGRRVLHVGVLFLGIAACILPVAARNYYLERDFVPISANGGLNFYIGNGPGATGTFHVPEEPGIAPGEITGKFEAEMSSGRTMTYAEVSNWWYGKTLSFIKANPRVFLKNLVWKMRIFWNAFEIPQIEWYAAQRQYSSLLRKPLVTTQLILPLAIVGVLLSLRAPSRMTILYLYLGLQTLGISLFFVTARYRMTVLPILCLFAASAVAWIIAEAARRRVLAVVGCVAVAGILFWAVSPRRLSVDMGELKRWNMVNTGLSHASEPSGLAQGIDLLSQVASSYPDKVDSHVFYGIALRNAGRYEESLHQFERALALDPNNPVVFFQIGKTHAALGRDSLAIAALTRSAVLAPLYEDAHEHLAFAYASLGRYAEALREFAAAVKINPTSSSLRLNLGVTYGNLGMKREAIEEFKLALRYDKANWKAMYNLAVALCEEGHLAEARRLLRDILDRDPGNSAAKKALSELGE